MAHLFGLFARAGEPAHWDVTWREATSAFGAPLVEHAAPACRVALFPQYAGERVTPPHSAGAQGFALGFGGKGTCAGEELVPPWLLCRYDAAQRTLRVETDRYGFALVYVRDLDAAVAFSTSASALSRITPRPGLDPSALAEMLAFDHLLGVRCLRLGVSLVPAGHELELSAAGSTFRRNYRAGDVALEAGGSFTATARELAELLQSAVARALPEDTAQRVLLPLSGGLDSRLLAACAARARANVEAFTFARAPDGGAEPADVLIAKSVAAQLGVPWRFVELSRDWLAGSARQAVALTDGHLDLVHSAGVSTTGEFSPGQCRLDGFGGDIGLGGKSISLFTQVARSPALKARALWRARARLDSEPWQRLLLGAARAEVRRRAQESLALSLEGVNEHVAAHDPRWLDVWLMLNRARRFTLNGSLLWRTCSHSAFPFFEPRFVDRMLAAPPHFRRGGRLQAALLHGAFPALAAIPWQKTGRPVSAPDPVSALKGRLRPRAFPRAEPFFDLEGAYRASPDMRRFFRELLLDRARGVARFGCFDLAEVERALAPDAERGSFARVGLLATLVLAEELVADG